MSRFHQLKSLPALAITISLVGILIAQVVFIYPELDAADGVINGDGRGYYDYLTSVFIDHDLQAQPVNDRFILEYKDKGVNKYFYGTGLLMLPFFLLAMLIALIAGAPMDALSWPFQWSMTLSAAVYWMIGLVFLSKLLKSFQVKDSLIAVALLVLTVGSNALYYTSVDCTASHVYSFAAIAGFLWMAKQWLDSNKAHHFFLTLLVLGLIVSIRPVNGLVLFFLPGLAKDAQSVSSRLIGLFRHPLRLLVGLLIALMLPAVQLLFYKLQTGDWIVWSYANEGFYFSDPAWWKFLFSFERGWMVYSPVFLLLLPAFALLIKASPWRGIGWTTWFILVVYILSAWWSWHYGGSFGSRPMIDFYVCFMLIIVLGWRPLLEKLVVRRVLLMVIMLFTLLNVSQVYQVQAGIITPWHMNLGKYFWTIGKLDESDEERLGGRNDTPPFHQHSEVWYDERPVVSSDDPHWSFIRTDGDVLVFDQEIEFNGSFTYTIRREASVYLGFELELERLEHELNAASEAYVVIEAVDPDGERYHYDAFFINDYPVGNTETWKAWRYRYVIPQKVETGDEVALYFWNKGAGQFELRDLHLKLRAYSNE